MAVPPTKFFIKSKFQAHDTNMLNNPVMNITPLHSELSPDMLQVLL